MDALDRIVVGVAMPETQPWKAAGLDPATGIAVRQSCQLAASLGVPLQMIAVLPDPEKGYFVSGSDHQRRASVEQHEAEQLLAGLQEDYADSGAQITGSVVFGTAWLEILRMAGASRKTLIVCGTRTNSAVRRLLFGSTAMKLLRNAPGPVWLVKPRIDDDSKLDVLAATDLSDVGADVIAAGVTLGRALPIQLTVMHVLDLPSDRRIARTGATQEDIAQWREQAEQEAEQELQEQLAGTDARSLEHGVQTQLAEGVPDACLLSAIEELDIDLLIMASSGRGGIPGMLFGNTAERLLPELDCSLLTLKPAEFDCPVRLD